MRLVQFVEGNFFRSEFRSCVGIVDGSNVLNVTSVLSEVGSVRAAFLLARKDGIRVSNWLRAHLRGTTPNRLPYDDLLVSGRMLPPVGGIPGETVLVSGTGLTHLGSAQQRDKMHAANSGPDAPGSPPKTDSQKMFDMGLSGGRPAAGERGVAPEWFYKGDAGVLRAHGQYLEIPEFAPDGGEEPEVVGIYIVDNEGHPFRLGFSQGNEWSDHVTENVNYLYLAPSKLRACGVGPELVTDFAFDDVKLSCRVLRDNAEIYHSGDLRSGEKNMSHNLANLEDHHFKHAAHRVPGTIHVHFFGTSKLSFPERTWKYQSGDRVEVAVEGLGAPLVNPILRLTVSDQPIKVEAG